MSTETREEEDDDAILELKAFNENKTICGGCRAFLKERDKFCGQCGAKVVKKGERFEETLKEVKALEKRNMEIEGILSSQPTQQMIFKERRVQMPGYAPQRLIEGPEEVNETSFFLVD